MGYLSILTVAIGLVVAPVFGQTTSAVEAARHYGVEISRETTYLTSPLKPNGQVDYGAAIAAELGKGVTAETNGAAILARISHPSDDGFKISPNLLSRLGVEAAERVPWVELPDSLNELIRSRELTNRPWRAAELPELANWLAKNEEAVRLFVEASKKPHWFVPPDSTDEVLLFVDHTGIWRNARSTATALWARSMQKLGAGDAAAWEDLAACERLADLISRSPDTVGRLVASAIHRGTLPAVWAVIEHGDLTPNLLDQIDASLRQHQDWPTGGDVIPQTERYQTLMQVTYTARGMQDAMDKNADGLRDRFAAAGLQLPDWNRVLRTVNDVYDMLQADDSGMDDEQRKRHRSAIADRVAAMVKVHAEANANLRADSTIDTTWLMPRVGETRDAYSDRIAAVLLITSLPGLERLPHVFAACNSMTSWTRVALALVRYQQDAGDYPTELQGLIPKYLSDLPTDSPLRPIRYERTSGGFILTNSPSGTPESVTKADVVRIQRDQ